jgi:ribosomal 50S subunit-associated protein YjgA (DUF615 family)
MHAETLPAIERLADRPADIIRLPNAAMFAIPLQEQHALQLEVARRRFEESVERIALVGRLAREQSLARIRSFEDLGLLLVPHSASKSYPLSFVENARFDRMNQWLQGFTAHDLGGVDVSRCETLDDWITTLDAHTEIRLIHSSGTSGKLSFLPRDAATSRQYAPGYLRQFDPFGTEPARLLSPEKTPILYLQYRHGAYGQQRMLDVLQSDLFGGDGQMIVPMNPGRFSADAISLGARIRAAEAKGELDRLDVGKTLRQRREAFLAEHAAAEQHFERFLDFIGEHLRGARVSVMGHIPQLHRLAVAGLKRGYESMFAPDSFVAGGGGLKGVALPDDWRETVARFLGPIKPTPGYGMSELVGVVRPCAAGRFHLPPWQIPFLLDPASGAQYPRTGVQKGRFAAFDLNASGYWGGFITGDEVTLSWGDTAPCACGRIGPYVESEIRRYGESEGGDDKITCAGAPQAYDKALDYVIGMGA